NGPAHGWHGPARHGRRRWIPWRRVCRRRLPWRHDGRPIPRRRVSWRRVSWRFPRRLSPRVPWRLGPRLGVGLWLPLVLWRILPFLRRLCVSVPGLRAAASAGLFAAGRLLRATSGAPALPSRDAPAPPLHLLHGDIVLI